MILIGTKPLYALEVDKDTRLVRIKRFLNCCIPNNEYQLLKDAILQLEAEEELRGRKK